jgi:hypothetical protein
VAQTAARMAVLMAAPTVEPTRVRDR